MFISLVLKTVNHILSYHFPIWKALWTRQTSHQLEPRGRPTLTPVSMATREGRKRRGLLSEVKYAPHHDMEKDSLFKDYSLSFSCQMELFNAVTLGNMSYRSRDGEKIFLVWSVCLQRNPVLPNSTEGKKGKYVSCILLYLYLFTDWVQPVLMTQMLSLDLLRLFNGFFGI